VIGRVALALLLGGSSIAHAQATAAATRAGDLQVGVGYTSAQPDYSPHRFTGYAAYADFDFRPNLGIEAEIHKVNTSGNDQSYQMTYDVGVRYFRTYGRVVPYVKAMVGRGDFNYPYGYTNLSYTLYAGGVGADFKVSTHLRVRGEYEYQRWTSFTPNGLTPQLITIGAAYHFGGKTRYK